MSQSTQIDTTRTVELNLVGKLPIRLWGLELSEWQARAWDKAGAETTLFENDQAHSTIIAGAEWVLSPAIARALVNRPGTVLIAEDGFHDQSRIAAIHCKSNCNTEEMVSLFEQPNPDWNNLKAMGLMPVKPGDLAGAYDEALRKKEPHYALSLLTTTPSDIEKRLFRGSYKGVTDLVTKYIWPWPALQITRLAANLKVTPNMITTIGLILTVIAFWMFWKGAWVPGLFAAWGMTFLDTVDGKLARTTMTYSAWGNVYDHGIDLIHPPFWYLAIYIGILNTSTPETWWLASLIIILVGYVIGRAIEGLFIWHAGFHMHVWKPIDSRMREVTARRNPNILIFTIACIAGSPAAGFGLVAVWTVICLAFHAFRLLQAYFTPQPHSSWLEA